MNYDSIKNNDFNTQLIDKIENVMINIIYVFNFN